MSEWQSVLGFIPSWVLLIASQCHLASTDQPECEQNERKKIYRSLN